jgi:hypothetical protein
MKTNEEHKSEAQKAGAEGQNGRKKAFILDISEVSLDLNSDDLRMAVGGCNPAQDPSAPQATYTNYGCFSDPTCDPLVS